MPDSDEIIVFKCDARIGTTAFIRYDEYHPPKRGAPADDKVVNSFTAVTQRGPESGRASYIPRFSYFRENI